MEPEAVSSRSGNHDIPNQLSFLGLDRSRCAVCQPTEQYQHHHGAEQESLHDDTPVRAKDLLERQSAYRCTRWTVNAPAPGWPVAIRTVTTL
jgi:hypothetical protein